MYVFLSTGHISPLYHFYPGHGYTLITKIVSTEPSMLSTFHIPNATIQALLGKVSWSFQSVEKTQASRCTWPIKKILPSTNPPALSEDQSEGRNETMRNEPFSLCPLELDRILFITQIIQSKKSPVS